MERKFSYECDPCTYWEAVHAIEGYDFHEEKYKKCLGCYRRISIYRDWIEKGGCDDKVA